LSDLNTRVKGRTPTARTQRTSAPERIRARKREGLPDQSHATGSALWEVVHSDDPVTEGGNDRTVLRRDALFRRSLALVDTVAATVALVVGIYGFSQGVAHLRPAAVLLLPFIVIVSKAAGLYDRDQHLLRKTTIDDTPAVLNVSVLFAMTVWLGENYFVSGVLNRGEVFGVALATFVFTMIGRTLARALVLANTPAERCVVLGNAGSAERIADKINSAPSVNAMVLGRVALDDGQCMDFPDGPSLLGHSEALPEVLVEHSVERVVIAPDGHDQEQILHLIRLIKALGVKVSVLPRLLEVVGSSSTFDELDGITLLGVRRYGLTHSSQVLKRGMDLVGAGLGVLMMAPLLLALAIAVKLDSRGPIFFRQRRIGSAGEEFDMLKFRSMVSDAEDMKDDLRHRNEADGLFKIEDDPRITRVGRFLRRTSLDELPQLFTVLKGDMSLVGPRPLVPDEDAMIEGWQRRRLAVKPGMTGLWQIFGSSRIPMHEMVKIDYLYGANWSLWLDLKILFRTVPHVVGRRGL
jgi:exopolysaccharide biosynthesis polyprenyl glycosylphosphotransferase